MPDHRQNTAEDARLIEDARRKKNWKRWGPYLSERQWGTVREDYSPDGDVWGYFPHDHARSRAYRWGEDGLLGICDRECRLCFAVALWNGRDPIIKERLFGLTSPEGNHGEDVKECYYYLDSSPTHSYLKALYKYPQAEFPYQKLVEENARRTRAQREYEITDTGVFDDGRYFDVQAEYAKNGPDDILIRLTVTNHGGESAPLHLLPTLWFRNCWTWGRTGEGFNAKPWMQKIGATSVQADHESLGKFRWEIEPLRGQGAPEILFTENQTNLVRLFGTQTNGGFVKDGINDFIVASREASVNPRHIGTKAAALYIIDVPAGGSVSVRMRLCAESDLPRTPFGASFDDVFRRRIRDCDEFYESRYHDNLSQDQRQIIRQAYAGLLWSKQFYCYVVKEWLEGDPTQPKPPAQRKNGRNCDWGHLFNRDVISMPDKWEFPWYAAWDLAFHMLPMAELDPQFAKDQLILFLREWYMHPSGQLPAYEFNLGDVNPPVHAWAAWRVYKIADRRGHRDRPFLARVFQKLMINFTWWVNRKDAVGKHIFGGGFLGLDNIGVFDRSMPLPNGAILEQADGTAWMAFFCSTMLSIALELAREDPVYEDVASKFFEHFVAIVSAINTVGGDGLWHEEDGFYYDKLRVQDRCIPLRLRSLVGVIPLFACTILDQEVADQLPGFNKRMKWFLENETDLARHITPSDDVENGKSRRRLLLAIPQRDRLVRMLRYVLDENEFLSPFGVRSLSKAYEKQPFCVQVNGKELEVRYAPGESDSTLFGGNSNWRGPVWFPLNYLLVEALERYHHFYGDTLEVECPTGSGHMMNLAGVAREIERRLAKLFLPDATGHRPADGDDRRYADRKDWKNLVLYYEHFHAETGRGLGASHQTGWTSLIARCLQDLAADQYGRDPKNAAVSTRAGVAGQVA
jgi:hypothetical protein